MTRIDSYESEKPSERPMGGKEKGEYCTVENRNKINNVIQFWMTVRRKKMV